MVLRKTDLFDDRPHPGPLPGERGKRSPRFGDAEEMGGSMVFISNKNAAANAIDMNKISVV